MNNVNTLEPEVRFPIAGHRYYGGHPETNASYPQASNDSPQNVHTHTSNDYLAPYPLDIPYQISPSPSPVSHEGSATAYYNGSSCGATEADNTNSYQQSKGRKNNTSATHDGSHGGGCCCIVM